MRKTQYDLHGPVNCTIALVPDLHEHDPASVLDILRSVRTDIIAVTEWLGGVFYSELPTEEAIPRRW